MFGLLNDGADAPRTQRVVRVTGPDGAVWLAWPEGTVVLEQQTTRSLRPSSAPSGPHVHDGPVTSPCAGSVTKREVASGSKVEAGERIGVFEAMKMEFALVAPRAGVVTWLPSGDGRVVQKEVALAHIEGPLETGGP